MTGKITSIGIDSGVIQAETMRNVSFDFSAVLTYDLAGLTPGQAVTFDLRNGNDSRAVNIVVQMKAQVPPLLSCLRYVGFQQRGCTRTYGFEKIILGEDTTRFMVTVDMGLFAKHRIGCQEGPALCLRLLTEQLYAAGATERSVPRFSLSEQNMLAHLERQSVPRKTSRPKRSRTAARQS